MTIATTTNRVILTGNGIAVDIPFPYSVGTPETDLVVIATVIATGVQTTKTFTTHWTWAGTADGSGHYPDGGTVTALVAPPSTETWTVYRDPVAVQGLDLVANDDLPAEATEFQFDYLTMLIQRVKDQINRTIQQPEGDAATISRLPSKVERASMFLAFDANGDPVAAAGTSADLTPVSSFINTLLDDVNAATARATLGAVGLTGNETVAGIKTFSSTPVFSTATINTLLNLLGGQIQFPATAVPSSDANVLDDYEEGTWTPTVGGSATYTEQNGTYVKIGRLVLLNMRFTINVLGTGSAHTISGLPFAPLTSTPGSVFFSSAAISPVMVVLMANAGATTATFQGLTAAGATMSSLSLMGNSTFIQCMLAYYATT